jgi:hypothetical protein
MHFTGEPSGIFVLPITFFLLRPPFDASFKFLIFRSGITTLAGVISSAPLFFEGLGVFRLIFNTYAPNSFLEIIVLVPILSGRPMFLPGVLPLFGVLPRLGVFCLLGVPLRILTS